MKLVLAFVMMMMIVRSVRSDLMQGRKKHQFGEVVFPCDSECDSEVCHPCRKDLELGDSFALMMINLSMLAELLLMYQWCS